MQRHLARYTGKAGIEFASIEASASTGSNLTTPNDHGQGEQNSYQIGGESYVRLSDMSS